jgi:DNA-binding MarR family transcriptional regulator
MDPFDRETIQMVMHHMPLFHQVIGADFRDLFRDYPDINQTHMKSLMFLKINGDTTMTRLSHLLRLEKGSVTTIADRLVTWGLVLRLTDPEDRRRSILRLTDNGRQLAESVRQAQSEHFKERIGRLDDEERQLFFSSLQTIERLLKKMADPDELRRFFHNAEEDCPHHKAHAPDEIPGEKHAPDAAPGHDRTPNPDTKPITPGGATHA